MIKKLMSAASAVVITLGLVGVVQSSSANAMDQGAPGNNGTLKVHEKGTPDGTESNDPKVCEFNLEAFGLDPGQTGTISFTVQGGDGPTGVAAGPFNFGPADADGEFATQYFNLQNGHYKATLFGKDVGNNDSQPTEKAKSKVFKVVCEGGSGGGTTPPPTPPAPVGGRGTTAPVASTPVPVPVPAASAPTASGRGSVVASLPVTSGSSSQIIALTVLLGSALAGAATYVVRARSGFSL